MYAQYTSENDGKAGEPSSWLKVTIGLLTLPMIPTHRKTAAQGFRVLTVNGMLILLERISENCNTSFAIENHPIKVNFRAWPQ